LCRQLAAEGVRRHVVDKGLGAVDLDDGKQLAIAPLQLGVPRDVYLVQLEPKLGAEPSQRCPRPLAQVAPRRVVEDDVSH